MDYGIDLFGLGLILANFHFVIAVITATEDVVTSLDFLSPMHGPGLATDRDFADSLDAFQMLTPPLGRPPGSPQKPLWDDLGIWE